MPKKFLPRFLRKIVIISIVMLMGLAMLSYFSPSAPELGVTNGKLSPCPDGDNCVCSMVESEEDTMEPIPFANQEASTQAESSRLKDLIATNFPRATLITDEDNYLRYEFRSLIFRFVDDVELLFDEQQKMINFRSASRVGKSDLGANRKRMEKIKELSGG